MPDRDRSKILYLLVILGLLILTAYVTTAFLIKLWPFGKTKPDSYVDLSPIAENVEKGKIDTLKPDLSKGVVGNKEDPYIISDGSPYDCADFSIEFPKGWLIVLEDDGRMAISVDLKNATNSIYLNQQNSLSPDLSDMGNILEGIKKSLGEGFTIDQVDTAQFLGRKCLTVSGSATRNGLKAGMLALAIPSVKLTPGYWVIGFFDPKDMSTRDKVVDSMASLKLKQAK